MPETPYTDEEMLSDTPPSYPSEDELALALQLLRAIEEHYLGHASSHADAPPSR